MLERGHDDLLSRADESTEHDVGGFSRAGGKYDLGGLATNERGYALPRQFDGIGGPTAYGVLFSVCVVGALKPREHGIQDRWIERSCGLEVEVDRFGGRRGHVRRRCLGLAPLGG